MPGPAVTGHDQDLAVGSSERRHVATFTPFRARHLKIEYGDVGPVRPRHGQRLGPVAASATTTRSSSRPSSAGAHPG